MIKRGYVDKVAATETTKWSRPWNLFVITPLGPVWIGRYETEQGARAAAKRRGIKLPAPKYRAPRRLP